MLSSVSFGVPHSLLAEAGSRKSGFVELGYWVLAFDNLVVELSCLVLVFDNLVVELGSRVVHSPLTLGYIGVKWLYSWLVEVIGSYLNFCGIPLFLSFSG